MTHLIKRLRALFRPRVPFPVVVPRNCAGRDAEAVEWWEGAVMNEEYQSYQAIHPNWVNVSHLDEDAELVQDLGDPGYIQVPGWLLA